MNPTKKQSGVSAVLSTDGLESEGKRMDDIEIDVEVAFNKGREPLCKHCRRDKGSHKAVTFNCPIGRGMFPQWNMNQVYEPRKKRSND